MRMPRWIGLLFFILVAPGAAHADSPQLDVVGHLSLPVGRGDVSVHGNLVAVATGPSSGHPRSEVQLIDIADPTQPRAGATVTAPRYVWYRDPRLLAVETPTFKGELLVVAGDDIPGTGAGGTEFWDVRNPSEPHLLSRLPAPSSGVRSLDLIRRDGRLFALLVVNGGDAWGDNVWVVDATDPARPLLVSIWQADPDIVRNVRRGVSLDALIAHVRANAEGTRAYVPTGDAGTFIVDLSDLTQPRTLGRAAYGMEDEGNAFDAAELAGGGVLVTTDLDLSSEPAGVSLRVLNPSLLRYVEHAIEPDFTRQLVATGPVRGEVVYVGSALEGLPLLADPHGKIALVDPAESPDITHFETKTRQMQVDQARRLQAAGAIGILFAGLLDRSSGVQLRAEIPGTSIDRGLADNMRVQLAAGKTVEVEMAAGPATFGFVRFWDLRNVHRKLLTQIGSFATPETRQTPPAGSYATFSAERLTVHDNRLYVTWSSDGVRVLDITDPSQPREIGHFIPPAESVNGGPSISSIGHVVEQNGLVFATGTDGLWILRDVPR
jgi:hypothetical protein